MVNGRNPLTVCSNVIDLRSFGKIMKSRRSIFNTKCFKKIIIRRSETNGTPFTSILLEALLISKPQRWSWKKFIERFYSKVQKLVANESYFLWKKKRVSLSAFSLYWEPVIMLVSGGLPRYPRFLYDTRIRVETREGRGSEKRRREKKEEVEAGVRVSRVAH